MIKLLGDEYKQFIQSFDLPRHYGLRINTLKWSVEEALAKLPFKLEPIDWVKEGFYYSEDERPAKHPYYLAGLYYIQEPSAMAPGAILPVSPGDRVLDLCAAPGGKSTQIAAKLQGKGVLVSNDISNERVKALVKNIELFGVRNSIVTNETPEKLATVFPEFFNKIVIDAPCSGEGMFRKNPEMVKSWEQHNVDTCVVMQKGILAEAAKMLSPGGYILYSTCTFAPEENERQMNHFLQAHPDFELTPIPYVEGFERGRREWADTDLPMEHTVRLWPHRLKGEGHYLALLHKKGAGELKSYAPNARVNEKELVDFRSFEKEVLKDSIENFYDGEFALFKGHLYSKPKGLPSLQGLKVVKSGWYLGELKKNRFEPSQSLAMGLSAQDVNDPILFKPDDEQLYRYLKGETLHLEGNKGWKLIAVDGYSLGWGKQVQGILKNAYPPGWRWLT